MPEWVESGAQLALLIDPASETIEIFRPAQDPELLAKPTSLNGEGPVTGFLLKIGRVWRPLDR